MDYKEAYEQYKLECPEELEALNALKARTAQIEHQRSLARAEKLARIEECRRRLYGEQSSC